MESILGGALIGVAASLMLFFNGRITGISGILDGMTGEAPDKSWRFIFVLGLLTGGIILRVFSPDAFTLISHASDMDYVLAGFLVGFGTVLGNGCTSGHGVCGISRLSIRSIVSTITFILFGILGVVIFKIVRGEV